MGCETKDYSGEPHRHSNDISSFRCVPFRLRVGVTGHRKLTHIHELARRVVEALATGLPTLFEDRAHSFMQSPPHTPIALSVLSPLAEGADCLVTKALLNAREFPDTRIEVVLPMNKVDYLKDFSTKESRQEFEELFARARLPIALKGNRLDEEPSVAQRATRRRQAYEDVGRYVVDHCDVLLALWDGKPSRGKGGTAEIVEYARKRSRPLIIISTISPHDITIEGRGVLTTESLSRIDFLNTYSMGSGEQQRYSNSVYQDLFDNPEGRKILDANKRVIRDDLIPLYVLTSTIAKRNQRIYLNAGLLVYAFSGLSVALVALGTLFHDLSTGAFSLEFLLLLAILSIVRFADREQSHTKWIENRFLAERLRCAMFFAACGVEASSMEPLLHVCKAHGSDPWMVRAFHEVWNRLPRMGGCQEGQCSDRVAFVRKHWIEKQLVFHRDKSTTLSKTSRILERAGLFIFFVAMAAALCHALLYFPGYQIRAHTLEHVLTFIAIALPAAGAAIGGIRSHREYARVERGSRNMAVVLDDLLERFSAIDSDEALASLLREAEEIMLYENHDWLMVMRLVELKAAT